MAIQHQPPPADDPGFSGRQQPIAIQVSVVEGVTSTVSALPQPDGNWLSCPLFQLSCGPADARLVAINMDLATVAHGPSPAPRPGADVNDVPELSMVIVGVDPNNYGTVHADELKSKYSSSIVTRGLDGIVGTADYLQGRIGPNTQMAFQHRARSFVFSRWTRQLASSHTSSAPQPNVKLRPSCPDTTVDRLPPQHRVANEFGAARGQIAHAPNISFAYAHRKGRASGAGLVARGRQGTRARCMHAKAYRVGKGGAVVKIGDRGANGQAFSVVLTDVLEEQPGSADHEQDNGEVFDLSEASVALPKGVWTAWFIVTRVEPTRAEPSTTKDDDDHHEMDYSIDSSTHIVQSGIVTAYIPPSLPTSPAIESHPLLSVIRTSVDPQADLGTWPKDARSIADKVKQWSGSIPATAHDPSKRTVLLVLSNLPLATSAIVAIAADHEAVPVDCAAFSLTLSRDASRPQHTQATRTDLVTAAYGSASLCVRPEDVAAHTAAMTPRDLSYLSNPTRHIHVCRLADLPTTSHHLASLARAT
ncbi:hypothetical protein BCR44DRAFT_1509868 [Catenaria anguillulae PL171]|uniref:Uncharacterized protein n=1 Tax=Catenaria anguillulae PL171 TaxID=765915 RepID=A0A1Y2HYT6_9FUNG|nr:hypothetical protein BCR44DRAFT_1509868 [Catenaria anguillulae PL171]